MQLATSIHNLSEFFLLFSKDLILMPAIFFGLIFFERRFLPPALLLLLAMILCPLLKSFFAIPYSPELVQRLGKEGFSFPSGHMFSASVFYGWFLLTNINKLLRFGLIFVIFGIGFGLIYEGYHNIYDVTGAVFFAFIVIALYRLIISCGKKKIANLSDHLIGSSVVLVLSLCLSIALILFYEIPSHSVMALYSILGITMGLWFRNIEKYNIKLIYLIMIVVSFFGFAYLLSIFKFNILFLQQLKWIPLAFAFPFLASIARRLNGNK